MIFLLIYPGFLNDILSGLFITKKKKFFLSLTRNSNRHRNCNCNCNRNHNHNNNINLKSETNVIYHNIIIIIILLGRKIQMPWAVYIQ